MLRSFFRWHQAGWALVYTPEEFAAMLANGNAFAEMVAEEGCLIYARQA